MTVFNNTLHVERLLEMFLKSKPGRLKELDYEKKDFFVMFARLV
jgi:hypothetical protein